MSKQSPEDLERIRKHEYKKNIKRVWVCLLVLIPVILGLTIAWSDLSLPFWLAMILNVLIGGLICLLVFIISDKIEQKKRVKKLLNPKDDDPFAD